MPTAAESAGLKHGWRSGLEETVAAALHDKRIPFRYESVVLHYTRPSKPSKYTPDFVLLSSGIVIETKGRFVTADRQKHLLIQQQHPDIEIRFVFSNPNARISKTSKTTYAKWCDSHGFKYAKSTKKEPIPAAWLWEPTNIRSLAAVTRLLREV